MVACHGIVRARFSRGEMVVNTLVENALGLLLVIIHSWALPFKLQVVVLLDTFRRMSFANNASSGR